MKKEIIILTKSIKRNDYCVAGIDATTGEWIRVVSDNEATEHAVSDYDMKYSNGTTARVFDIVQINFIEKVPTMVQPENWLFDDTFTWKKVGESNLQEILKLHPYETPNRIFYNTGKSVVESEIDFSAHSSLLLVRIPTSTIFIKTFERKKFNYNFTYNSETYQYISITDEEVRRKYHASQDGSYPFRSNLPVVFSLADIYKGEYYKIAAQFLSAFSF